jgi:glycosidase
MSHAAQWPPRGSRGDLLAMRYLTLCLLGVALLARAAAAPSTIQHLEPLNWWVGMKDPALQLMVHGPGLGALTPAVDYPGVQITGVHHTDNPDFLFVDLLIAPDTQPGTVPLVFKHGSDIVVRYDYRLDARRSGSAERRGFDAHDAIYLVTPDRFANGDLTNDSSPALVERANRALPGGRHGGDLAGLRSHLDYIAGLGFTQLWSTPLLENNQPTYSYHGYSITDNYRIDARFGSNEDYRALSREARAHGLGLIQDIVLNHIGTGHWWMRSLPAADWINHASHPVFTNNQHFSIADPHASPEDRETFVSGWFDTTMPDLNQRNPLLTRYLIQNSIWWIEYADLSGIREDTFSYSDKSFLQQWCAAIFREYPHFNIVGEEMDEEPALVAYWQKGAHNRDGYDSGLPSVTDFPVVDLLPGALNAPESYNSGLMPLYTMIATDFVYADPMNLLVFPDNHDRPRIFSQLHENQDLLRTALLFYATTRGIPQFYYGTEVLTPSPVERNDGLIRSDLPGGWPGDRANAFTGSGLTPDQRAMQDYVRRLFTWRQHCPAVTEGTLTHYVPAAGFYVYFRAHDRDRVMVVINKNPAPATLDLARFAAPLAGTATGKNILTGESVDLRTPLKLPALTSIAIEYTVSP